MRYIVVNTKDNIKIQSPEYSIQRIKNKGRKQERKANSN